MFCIQAARAAGASTVIVSEPAEARRRAAIDMGADVAVDPLNDDAVAAVVTATDGLGAAVVFDCAGVGSTLDQAFDMARQGGQVMLVAVPWESLPVLPANWQAREVGMQTSFGARWQDFRTAIDLIRTGRITIGPMVSQAGFIPLDDIQQAFESLTRPTTQLQVVVQL
jgi:threonine dehydrogenase-like Zn-dependent dehydrogenase